MLKPLGAPKEPFTHHVVSVQQHSGIDSHRFIAMEPSRGGLAFLIIKLLCLLFVLLGGMANPRGANIVGGPSSSSLSFCASPFAFGTAGSVDISDGQILTMCQQGYPLNVESFVPLWDGSLAPAYRLNMSMPTSDVAAVSQSFFNAPGASEGLLVYLFNRCLSTNRLVIDASFLQPRPAKLVSDALPIRRIVNVTNCTFSNASVAEVRALPDTNSVEWALTHYPPISVYITGNLFRKSSAVHVGGHDIITGYYYSVLPQGSTIVISDNVFERYDASTLSPFVPPPLPQDVVRGENLFGSIVFGVLWSTYSNRAGDVRPQLFISAFSSVVVARNSMGGSFAGSSASERYRYAAIYVGFGSLSIADYSSFAIANNTIGVSAISQLDQPPRQQYVFTDGLCGIYVRLYALSTSQLVLSNRSSLVISGNTVSVVVLSPPEASESSAVGGIFIDTANLAALRDVSSLVLSGNNVSVIVSTLASTPAAFYTASAAIAFRVTNELSISTQSHVLLHENIVAFSLQNSILTVDLRVVAVESTNMTVAVGSSVSAIGNQIALKWTSAPTYAFALSISASRRLNLTTDSHYYILKNFIYIEANATRHLYVLFVRLGIVAESQIASRSSLTISMNNLTVVGRSIGHNTFLLYVNTSQTQIQMRDDATLLIANNLFATETNNTVYTYILYLGHFAASMSVNSSISIFQNTIAVSGRQSTRVYYGIYLPRTLRMLTSQMTLWPSEYLFVDVSDNVIVSMTEFEPLQMIVSPRISVEIVNRTMVPPLDSAAERRSAMPPTDLHAFCRGGCSAAPFSASAAALRTNGVSSVLLSALISQGGGVGSSADIPIASTTGYASRYFPSTRNLFWSDAFATSLGSNYSILALITLDSQQRSICAAQINGGRAFAIPFLRIRGNRVETIVTSRFALVDTLYTPYFPLSAHVQFRNSSRLTFDISQNSFRAAGFIPHFQFDNLETLPFTSRFSGNSLVGGVGSITPRTPIFSSGATPSSMDFFQASDDRAGMRRILFAAAFIQTILSASASAKALSLRAAADFPIYCFTAENVNGVMTRNVLEDLPPLGLPATFGLPSGTLLEGGMLRFYQFVTLDGGIEINDNTVTYAFASYPDYSSMTAGQRVPLLDSMRRGYGMVTFDMNHLEHNVINPPSLYFCGNNILWNFPRVVGAATLNDPFEYELVNHTPASRVADKALFGVVCRLTGSQSATLPISPLTASHVVTVTNSRSATASVSMTATVSVTATPSTITTASVTTTSTLFAGLSAEARTGTGTAQLESHATLTRTQPPLRTPSHTVGGSSATVALRGGDGLSPTRSPSMMRSRSDADGRATQKTRSATVVPPPVLLLLPPIPALEAAGGRDASTSIGSFSVAASFVADPVTLLQLDAVSSILEMADCSDAVLTLREGGDDGALVVIGNRRYDISNNPLHIFVGPEEGAADRGALVTFGLGAVLSVVGWAALHWAQRRRAATFMPFSSLQNISVVLTPITFVLRLAVRSGFRLAFFSPYGYDVGIGIVCLLVGAAYLGHMVLALTVLRPAAVVCVPAPPPPPSLHPWHARLEQWMGPLDLWVVDDGGGGQHAGGAPGDTKARPSPGATPTPNTTDAARGALYAPAHTWLLRYLHYVSKAGGGFAWYGAAQLWAALALKALAAAATRSSCVGRNAAALVIVLAYVVSLLALRPRPLASVGKWAICVTSNVLLLVSSGVSLANAVQGENSGDATSDSSSDLSLLKVVIGIAYLITALSFIGTALTALRLAVNKFGWALPLAPLLQWLFGGGHDGAFIGRTHPYDPYAAYRGAPLGHDDAHPSPSLGEVSGDGALSVGMLLMDFGSGADGVGAFAPPPPLLTDGDSDDNDAVEMVERVGGGGTHYATDPEDDEPFATGIRRHLLEEAGGGGDDAASRLLAAEAERMAVNEILADLEVFEARKGSSF